MGSAEATPRPWLQGKAGDDGYSPSVAPCHIWTSKGPGYGLVATTAPYCQPYEQQRVNAELIVRAVNAHDALLSFAEYVAGMDPNNRAPLFEKARAVIALVNGGADPASTNEEAA